MVQVPKVLEVEIYLTKYSEMPIHKSIVVTYNETQFYRELKRELGSIASENVLTEATVKYLLEQAAKRSNSAILETITLRVFLDDLKNL